MNEKPDDGNAGTGELDGVLAPLTFTYLGVGVILWVVGCGLKPLAVAAVSILTLRWVYNNIERG